MLSPFPTIIFLCSSCLPAVFAVTSSTWGAIRYYSSNNCQPANLLYIESFPLNVCYKTGMEKYYKMNTVTKSGVSGCPSCWHYVRQQFSDANCIVPSTNANSMVYRDTSTSCGLITGSTNVWASTTTYGTNFANTGVTSTDTQGAIRLHSFETSTCNSVVGPAESILIKSGVSCSGNGAIMTSYTTNTCSTATNTWTFRNATTSCAFVNGTLPNMPKPFPYFSGLAWPNTAYQTIDASQCNPIPLTPAQVAVIVIATILPCLCCCCIVGGAIWWCRNSQQQQMQQPPQQIIVPGMQGPINAGYGQPVQYVEQVPYGQPVVIQQPYGGGPPMPQQQFGQPAYGQPQPAYGQPVYGQPQPAYGQPVYSQPTNVPYGQPMAEAPPPAYNQTSPPYVQPKPTNY